MSDIEQQECGNCWAHAATGVAGWSDGFGENPREINGNITVNARLKALYKSNDATAFSNNSQRKFVRTQDGWLHQVYESMGHV